MPLRHAWSTIKLSGARRVPTAAAQAAFVGNRYTIFATRHHMKNVPAILTRLFTGLTSPVSVALPTKYIELQGSDLQRIRGDVARVGATFRTVLSQKAGTAKADYW